MAGLRELIGEEPPDLPRGDGIAVEAEEPRELGRVLKLEHEKRDVQENEDVRRAQIFTAASEHDRANVASRLNNSAPARRGISTDVTRQALNSFAWMQIR